MAFITPDQRTSSAPNGSRLSLGDLESLVNRPFKKVDWRGSVVSQKMEAAKSRFVKKTKQEQRRRSKLSKLEMLSRIAKPKMESVATPITYLNGLRLKNASRQKDEPQNGPQVPKKYLSHPMRLERMSRLFCQVTGALHRELVSGYKGRKVVEKRQMCMWLLRRHSKRSYPVIGRQFGGRDHSTVVHACRKINERPDLLAIAQEIETTVLLLEREMYGDG